MYINLPSKNHYRRPASYASKGYTSRRMAVDFAVPLITNVKNAKMLAEALVRKLPLDVSTIDSKSSHETHTLPGLINVSTFVPGLAEGGSKDLIEATKASVCAGFTQAIILPVGTDSQICDSSTLEIARENVRAQAYCSFALCVSATSSNSNALDEELKAESKALFIPFNFGDLSTSLTSAAAHFAIWPSDKPVITNAKGSSLASILLLASLHGRSLHVTDVQASDDLLLISLSKAKGLKVTCDVSVYSLFFAREKYNDSNSLPTAVEQKNLWQRLDVVDAFSVGSTPYCLAQSQGTATSVWSGMEEALPLLLTAVSEGRLTLQDIRLRLHDNPVRIFGLPEQVNTHVEIVIGRKAPFTKGSSSWSPLDKGSVTASVHRVVIHGQTAFLDGHLSPNALGRDISAASLSHAPTVPAVSVEPAAQAAGAGPVSHTMLYGPSPAPATTAFSQPRITPHPSFHRKHILTVKQITSQDMYDLFSLANEMRLQVERNGTLDILRGKVLCTVFYEPSTRTSASFDAAMKRCGGSVVPITADTSSVAKGESLPDTIRSLACYGDAIVIRHPDIGSAQLAAKYSPVPIINAGDGIGEHPTQASVLCAIQHSLLTLQ